MFLGLHFYQFLLRTLADQDVI